MDNLNYGVIGNCRSAALISDKGSIDWMCLPDFDSSSVFARLLDAKQGGSFSISVDSSYKVSQRYIHHTNILCTEFRSEEGSFELIDFMPRYKTSENEYFAPPEIYRYIRHLSGTPRFRVVYDPRLNYATACVSHYLEDSYIRTVSCANANDCIYLYTSLNSSDILEGRELVLSSHQFMLVSYNQKLIDIDINRVYLEYQRTKVYWLNWTNRSKKYQAYHEEITRSMLVLKLMSFQPSGAVLAAITTSLPEVIGEERNWDYRFCWLRDASMSIDTLLKMGHFKAARRFINYIKGILKTKHDKFQIMYGIRGERELDETILTHLSGYEGSGPVRIGNAAYSQRQNDVFGYLLNVILQYYTYFPGTLDEIEDMWEIVRNIVRNVTSEWEKPDKGIWEIRNEEKHFVFSKVMCWVALDRAIRIAKLLERQNYVIMWTQVADKIKNDVLTKGWKDEIQSFSQTYCNLELDSSLLLMESYGFIEAEDEKFIKTVIATKKKLFHKGLMFRYRNHDDYGTPKSSFIICTFWMIDALVKIGQKDEATRLFNDLLVHANHLGLFSEDMDFETKRLLGNFPQAYSHLALINSATLLTGERKLSKFIRP